MRVYIDRHVKLDRRREQTIVARVIEETALRRAIDHGADEAEFLDRAHKLGGRRIRALHR